VGPIYAIERGRFTPHCQNHRSDPNGQQQYGLIAEEVARVYPELVGYDHDGKPLTVRYLELSAMLLNELQKQTRELQKQERENKELSQENRELRSEIEQVRTEQARERAAQTRERAAFDERLAALERSVWASQAAAKLSAVALQTESPSQERRP
jgi:hypothetical protein